MQLEGEWLYLFRHDLRAAGEKYEASSFTHIPQYFGKIRQETFYIGEVCKSPALTIRFTSDSEKSRMHTAQWGSNFSPGYENPSEE